MKRLARQRTAQLVPGHELTAGDVVEQNGRIFQVSETKSSIPRDGEPTYTITLEGEQGDSITATYPVSSESPVFHLVEMDPAQMPGAEGTDYSQIPPDGAAPGGGPDDYAAVPMDAEGEGVMPPGMEEMPPEAMMGVPPEAMGVPPEALMGMPPEEAAGGMMMASRGHRTRTAAADAQEDAGGSDGGSYDDGGVHSPVEEYLYWTRQHDLNPATSLKEYDQSHRLTQDEYDCIESEVMEDLGIHVEGVDPEDDEERPEIQNFTAI